MFWGKNKQERQEKPERPPYDLAREEELIAAGDYEGWLSHIGDRDMMGLYNFGYLDAAYIAKTIYRIMENQKK